MDVTPYLGSTPLSTLRILVPMAIPGFESLSAGERNVALQNVLAAADLESRRGAIVRQLIDECAFSEVVPAVYSRFRPLVLDSVEFLLMRLDRGRLARLLVGQFLMPETSTPGRRLAVLARELPVLHKIGQMVARNEHLDPAFRMWLVTLETQAGDASVRELVERAAGELARGPIGAELAWDADILAEASVGAVIPFGWVGMGGGAGRRGVAKLVKPSAVSRLAEDLPALEALAAWLARRRERYGDLGIDYIGVLCDVRDALAAETDPSCEQRNIALAALQYRDAREIRIPALFPFSTPSVTAMERLDGVPLPEVAADRFVRRKLASQAFRALIIAPMLSDSDQALIHGDPHAGNLLALPVSGGTGWAIGVIDWSQAGILDRRHRRGLRDLMMGFMLCESRILKGALAVLFASSGSAARLEGHIRTTLGSRPRNAGDAFEASLTLIDRLVMDGFRFPKNLLLFRKAWFTLRGVLLQLDPGFDPRPELLAAIGRRVIRDLPRRVLRCFPLCWMNPAGTPFLSDTDLLRLAFHAY
ncbi:MAG TPA: AarF/UbiB family protein [Candidatus Ozemobacteraceae bacterium]|nr:AarF/UbiB family protein [Candidatus Ozemobacteraceae bacterium]